MIQVRREAHLDVLAGAAHYSRITRDLGHRFLDSVDYIIRHIENDPEFYAVKLKNDIRRALVKNFPYAVYYRIESGTPIVHAVISTKASLKTILKKIQ